MVFSKAAALGLLIGGGLLLGVLGASLVVQNSQRASTATGADLSDAAYIGTDLGGQQAHDFRLVDQRGAKFSLADFRGKIVAMAFMDPRCTDACPLTAFHFRLTENALGAEAEKVVFLAVNVNKNAATVEEVVAASEKWGISQLPNWHFLTGSEAELRPVWDAYHIVAEGPPKPGKSQELQHTPGVYIIDRAGRQRWYVSVPFGSDGFRPLSDILLQHIQALLKDKG